MFVLVKEMGFSVILNSMARVSVLLTKEMFPSRAKNVANYFVLFTSLFLKLKNIGSRIEGFDWIS